MKYITFTVPCYNSQAYMRKCVDSLLTGGEDVEIIIVNDGSKDDTIHIANEYKEKYPTIVKVVDKENGGHGSGVNAGIQNATGLYLKVVDSDDWLDPDALKKLLDTLKEHVEKGEMADLYVTNFIYDKPELGKYYVSEYTKMMPENTFVSWEEVKKFRLSHMLLMHALLYRTEVVRASNTVLPEHTFYVDNLYAYKPLPYTQKLYYLNVNLYHYFIGRDDQSVNKKNFSKRYDQQIRVMKCLVDSYTWEEIKAKPKGLKRYMWHCIDVIIMNTIYFACIEDSPERRAALKEFWQYVKAKDKALYRKFRYASYAVTVNFLPWKLRGWVMDKGYDFLCRKIYLG